jgi:cytosine/adenosine deaminase-related metal-dependent hydrolase
VIRGAIVLTIDASWAISRAATCMSETARSSRSGESIDAPGLTVLDARNMICMPGFIDTHWHLWTSLCRSIIRIDDRSAAISR